MPHALPHLHLLPGMHGTPELYRPFIEAMDGAPSSTTHYADDPAPTAESILGQIRDSVPQGVPYLLLAESFSGSFAAKFAATRPDNLVGLVLVNTFLRVPLPPLACAVGQLPFRPPWAFNRRLLLDKSADDQLEALTKLTMSRLTAKLVAGRFRLLYHTDARPDGAQLQVPTLVLHGANDLFVLPYNSERMERQIPLATRTKLPGPHLLVQTHPRKSLDAIREWWAQTGNKLAPGGEA